MKRWLCFCMLLLLGPSAWGQQPQSTTMAVRVVVEGYGPPATYGDTLDVNYEIRLSRKGEVVDANPEGQPYKVILGSTSGLEGMLVGLVGARRGEKRELLIPPSMGFGERAAGAIPPNSTLLVTVSVLKITRGDDHDHDGDGKPDHPAHEHQDDHDHDGDGQPDHDSHEHGPHDEHDHDAEEGGGQPALFEYLLRDFFTRPWRKADAAAGIWKANGWLTLAIVLLLAVPFLSNLRRGKRS